MAVVSKRELNQHTADVLALVLRDGEPVIVTERGVARWRIVPASPHWDPFARAAAEGRLTPAAAIPRPWPEAVADGRGPEEIDRLIAEAKDDR
jgi:prevent-host-death family protein